MDDCIFCKIVRGEFGTRLIAENEHAIAFDDIEPLAPVHALVVPKTHLATLQDATNADESLLAGCLELASQVAQIRGIDQSGYRVITNSGPDAGQTVFHLHFHVVGGKRLGSGV